MAKGKSKRKGTKGRKGKSTGPRPEILKRPRALWAVERPWSKRPKDVGGGVARAFGAKTRADSIRSMAEGWRPPSVAGGTKYELLEQNATVWGGIRAMKLAGIEPWVSDKVKKPKLKMAGRGTKRDVSSKLLLQAVKRIAGQEGSKRKFANIDDAVKYVRRRVKDEGLAKVAWGARGKLLTQFGVKKLKVRKAVDGATATGLMTAGMVLHAAAAPADATVVGLIVGIPMHVVGGILNTTSVVMTGFQGRTEVELVRTQAAEKKFQHMLTSGLEEYGLRVEAQRVEAEMQAEIEATQAETARLEAQAKTQSDLATSAVLTLAVVGVGGAVIGLTYLIFRGRRGV